MRWRQTALVQQSPRMGQWDLTPPGNLVESVTASYIEAPRTGISRRVPMWLFVANGQRVVCRRPVQIEISEEDGEVIAACERLHVFACGANYADAVASLHEQIVHFCNEYRGLGPDEVIGQAVQIRELYHQYFDIEQK